MVSCPNIFVTHCKSSVLEHKPISVAANHFSLHPRISFQIITVSSDFFLLPSILLKFDPSDISHLYMDPPPLLLPSSLPRLFSIQLLLLPPSPTFDNCPTASFPLHFSFSSSSILLSYPLQILSNSSFCRPFNFTRRFISVSADIVSSTSSITALTPVHCAFNPFVMFWHLESGF